MSQRLTATPTSTPLPLSEQLRAAIAEHGFWKMRLREFVRYGRGELDVATTRADDVCDFGHWVYFEADQRLRQSPRFVEIRELHSDLHLVSSEVLDLVATGRQAEAEAMLGLRGRYSTLSVALTSRLMAWQKTLRAYPAGVVPDAPAG